MSIRVQRVEELLRKQLSELISEKIGGEYGLVTITSIIATADFKLADVYFSIIPEEQAEIFMKILEKERSGFQHILGKRLKMKFTPKLIFHLDQSKDKIDQVDELLKEIQDES